MKRIDEEFSKSQFDSFIRQHIASSAIDWEEGDEPPDYYLYIDNVRYAVEVTGLIELISIGQSSRLPAGVIHELFQRFADGVRDIALAENSLQGHYVISFLTHITNFSEVKDEIQANLLDYIRRTKEMDEAPLELVFEREVSEQMPQRCGIQKSKGSLTTISVGGPTRWKWEGDASTDICNFLKTSLEEKRKKLKDISEPKILLLFDQYHFADRRMYEECYLDSSLISFFHAIFVVQSNRQGFLLYTKGLE